jgi:hypothetical protein
MSEIKYTKDGKKVVVIGNLNAKESIVQEIYVNGESEIPMGENFIVQTLLDNPLKSWKASNIEQQELYYSKKEDELERLNNSIRKEIPATREYLKSIIKHRGIESEDFDLLVDFMSGSITHLAFTQWGNYEIKDIKKAMGDCDYSPKMLTIFGMNEDRFSFQYNLNHYSDGSGGGEIIIPCRSYEHALKTLTDAVIKSIGDSGEIDHYQFKAIDKYDIKVSKERMKEHHKSIIKKTKDTLSKRIEETAKIQEAHDKAVNDSKNS